MLFTFSQGRHIFIFRSTTSLPAQFQNINFVLHANGPENMASIHTKYSTNSVFYLEPNLDLTISLEIRRD